MPEFDGQQNMEISYVRVLDVIKRVFSDPSQASKMQYHPKVDFTLNGERRYSTFASGAMWENAQREVGEAEKTIVGQFGFSLQR